MNNLKKAIEVKEQMDKKRLDYIKSLDFDTLYDDIAGKLDRMEPGYTNLIIKNDSIFKTINSATFDNGRFLYEKEILLEVKNTLTNLGYVVEPVYALIGNSPTGMKIYWDPKDVPNKQ